MCRFPQRSTMFVGDAMRIRASLAQHAVLNQEKVEFPVLDAIDPGCAGKDEDGEVGGHGA